MHRRSGLIFSFCCASLATWTPFTHAQTTLPPAQVDAIERAVHDDVATSHRVGLSIAIVRGGHVVLARGFGHADLEHDVPATADTVYRLASISKTFTAVAAMQLVDDGRLDLDADIRTILPEFPEKRWPVTARQLLGHLAGIRHYRMGEIWSTEHYADVFRPLDIFRDDALLHEPGTKFLYTTYGYNLLGAVVARVAGKPFLTVLREGVFEPCGMRTIRDDHVSRLIPHRARGYRIDRHGDLWNCVHVDTSNKIPGGGLVADVHDLARYAIALMDGKLVADSTRTLMWTPGRTTDGNSTHYGLGWSVRRREGRKEVLHTGGQPGTSTALLLVPEQRAAVVALSNLEDAGTLPLARRIVDIVLGED